MKHRPLAVVLFFIALLPTFATDIEVPQTMDFGGMKLRIKESARRKIAENAQKLRTGGKFYQVKLDRVNLYFPVIERVLAEEGLPEEFKFLALQESDLISDAVSTSNAVGYWQFKKATAQEMGLTVDGSVDERKHIVAATRAAARYLKKNNFFLQNWVHALLSYNTGVGGCRALVGDKGKGVDRMDIDDDTHWYILKFLAHRVAFEDQIGQTTPTLALLEYPDAAGKTLQQVARELDLDEEQLAAYNKWLDTRRVPDEKNYTVVVPVPMDRVNVLAARLNAPVPGPTKPKPTLARTEPAAVAVDLSEQGRFPQLEKKSGRGAKLYRINGKPGIMAGPGDNSVALAEQGDVSLAKFLKYNDLEARTPLVPGQVYYLKRKRGKAKIHFHVAAEGETYWSVSQKYGITLPALLRKNRLRRPEKLRHGQVVWLRYIRPASTPVEYKNIPKPETAVARKETPASAPSRPGAKTTSRNTPAATTKEPVAATPGKATPNTTTIAPTEDRRPEPVATPPAAAGNAPSAPAEPVTPKPDSAVASSPEKASTPEPVTTTIEPKADMPARTEAEPLVFFKTHEVAPGQTLFAIAKLYGVSVSDLRRWNGLADADGLKPGQKLIVGEETAEEAASAPATRPVVTPVANDPVPAETFTEHTVQAGDTLYKIARQYGVTVQQILDWNNKTASGVSVGEKLKIGK
jgi:membrane-bound lytic murein transglycosylase D